DGVAWLGVQLRARRLVRPGAVEFGYVVADAKIADMLGRVAAMTTPPSDKIDASAFNIARWIVSINDQLREWQQAYRFADNAPELWHLLDDVTRDRVAQLLHAVTGTVWSELRRQYQVRLPRGFWTYEVPGARLC